MVSSTVVVLVLRAGSCLSSTVSHPVMEIAIATAKDARIGVFMVTVVDDG